MFWPVCLSVVFLAVGALPAWSQANSSPAVTGVTETDERMLTPAPVSIEGYSTSFSSETPRTNYLRGGLTFSPAYDDNVSASAGHAASDVSYSVWPSISLDQSRSRLSWNLSYSPGFTFYQKTTSLDQADHNVGLGAQYRLTPHVTLKVNDNFVKTSNFFSPFTESQAGNTTGALQNPNLAVIAPIGDQYINTSNAQITYQFSQDGMVGATGTLYDLRYPNRNPIGSSLFDSTTRGAEAFYTHRLSGKHYIGANYRFQDLLTNHGNLTTQTHSMVFFYTLYLSPAASLSLFGGPEYSDTHGATLIAQRTWSPTAGLSVGWQGVHTSLAAGVSRRVGAGGGLGGAVRSEGADVSIRRRLSPTMGLGLAANYSMNEVLDSVTAANTGGHIVSGSVVLDRQFRENFGIQFTYMKLHQTYPGVSAISAAPDRNRVAVSLSYHFQRPLGR